MALKKANPYSKVNFETLKNEITGAINYITSEPVNETLEDSIEYKITQKGGVAPLISSTIEDKINTQLGSLDTCSKIIKVIFDKESLSPFVKNSIEALISKLDEIEEYFLKTPRNLLANRMITISSSRGAALTVLASSKEDQIKQRDRALEKIFKLKPLFSELEERKNEIVLKGGSEIPESMLYE